MLRPPPSGDAYLTELARTINAELSRKEPTVVGLVYDGTNLLLRFRAPYGVTHVQVHVQSSAVGGMTYDSATAVSSTLVDCRADRLQDQTIAVTAGLRYAIFLVPVQYDGAGTKVMYDGEGGRPDAMASVTTWIGAPTPHNVLSASHGDATAASVVRGDIVTGQGSTPAWARLAKGTEGYYLRSGATDVAWAALAAADLTGTALPASIVTSSLTAVGTITSGVWNAGAVTSSGDIRGTTGTFSDYGYFKGGGIAENLRVGEIVGQLGLYVGANRDMVFLNDAAGRDFIWYGSGMWPVASMRLLPAGALTLAAGITATSLTVGANQVVGARGAAVTDPPADPSGGAIQDAESRAAIATLNDAVADMQARCEAHGLWSA